MSGTTMPGAAVPGRAAARQAWLAEKAAVAGRYRAYARAWVCRRLARMERRGEIPIGMGRERFVELRRRLFDEVPEYDDATGRARRPAKGSRP